MLTVTEIAGFIGVGLAGAAYVPQIWHLVRVHCAAGISRLAFSLWLGATLLATTHAIVTGATVFIVLGGVQILASTLILVSTTKYCPRMPNEVLVARRWQVRTRVQGIETRDESTETTVAPLGAARGPQRKGR